MDKSKLDPLRLLHFLALAVVAARLVPRDWRGLTTPLMRAAIRCGQNWLPIYCLGVLLTYASHVALLDISDGLAMQIALSLAGIAAMIATATLLNSISTKPTPPDQRFRLSRSIYDHIDAIARRLGADAADQVPSQNTPKRRKACSVFLSSCDRTEIPRRTGPSRSMTKPRRSSDPNVRSARLSQGKFP